MRNKLQSIALILLTLFAFGFMGWLLYTIMFVSFSAN